jgi:hypothetical protein
LPTKEMRKEGHCYVIMNQILIGVGAGVDDRYQAQRRLPTIPNYR